MFETRDCPSVTGWSASRTLVPDSAPWVTTSTLGTPRLPLAGFAGFGAFAGLATGAVERPFVGRGATRRPNRTGRLTGTVVITNSHSTARKPSRMIVSVSSDISRPRRRRRSPVALVEDDGGVAQDDAVAVLEAGRAHPLAVDHDAVGRARVDEQDVAALTADLRVVAGDAWVVEAYVAVGAPSDAGHRGAQLDRCTAEVEPGATAAGRPRRGRRRRGLRLGAGHGGAAHPEAPGLELLVELEVDRDPSEERVPLLLRVLAHHRRQLGPERVGVGAEPLVVVRPERDRDRVGHHRAPARDDRRAVGALLLRRAGDLDGLDLGPQGAGERAAHHLLDAPLEPLQDAHATSSGSRGGCLLAAHGSGPVPLGRRGPAGSAAARLRQRIRARRPASFPRSPRAMPAT